MVRAYTQRELYNYCVGDFSENIEKCRDIPCLLENKCCNMYCIMCCNLPCLSVYDIFSWEITSGVRETEKMYPGRLTHRLRGWNEQKNGAMPEYWAGVNWSDHQDTDFQKVPDYSSKTHDNGWTVKGYIEGTNYFVVYKFEAEHPIHGYVKGNTQNEITCSNENAFQEFIKYFPFLMYDPMSE